MKILITGFEPFAGRTKNGSQTLARALHGKIIIGYQVESEFLPVAWEGFGVLLHDLIGVHKPDIVLGLGEGKETFSCLEQTGRNIANGTDNEGVSRINEPLEDDGPAERAATIHWAPEWFSYMPGKIKPSQHAGQYLCNHFLFSALGSARVPLGFLHLPVQGEQNDADYCSDWIPVIYRLLSQNVRIVEEI